MRLIDQDGVPTILFDETGVSKWMGIRLMGLLFWAREVLSNRDHHQPCPMDIMLADQDDPEEAVRCKLTYIDLLKTTRVVLANVSNLESEVVFQPGQTEHFTQLGGHLLAMLIRNIGPGAADIEREDRRRFMEHLGMLEYMKLPHAVAMIKAEIRNRRLTVHIPIADPT